MKLALASHGYPPETSGGTERSVQALARALAREGHQVLVVSGSLRRAEGDAVELEAASDRDPHSGATLEVLRLRRGDLYFDHWQKSLHPGVSRALRGLLRERAIEVLHVHHWLRLSRDLVHAAALEGVPCVVSLHDAWASCPITFRVRPDTRAACQVPAGPHPCVACAGRLAPRTPWVPTDEAWMALARRQQDVARELALARAITVPTAAHAAAVERGLGLEPGALRACVLPPAYERRRAPPPTQLDPPQALGRLQLVSWGSLDPHKGVDLLLEALELSPARERIALTLLGRGEDGFVHRLRNRACGLGVTFAGAYDPADLARHGGVRAHAFVSATRAHESHGLVLDEALELGLPLVAPRTPAFAERLEGTGAALLFEPGDARSLARSLERLLEEPGLVAQLQGAARSLADGLPDAASIAARTVGLYAAAVGAGAPAATPGAWFEARMAEEALRAWDESLARCSADELGLEP